MKYTKVVEGKFIDRPNRFVAHVDINGTAETVHVKNTGRCRELLLPDSRVILAKADNPQRKTAYDLIAVYKKNFGLINMDSQAPNKVVLEWLEKQDYDFIKPEYAYGNSRIDFYMEKRSPSTGEQARYLMEVKGCTLEIDGIGYFPDAPTLRGVKHLGELSRAVREGYHAIMAYVIQMENVYEVLPNAAMHPEYAAAVAEAVQAGVKILFLYARVSADSLEITGAKFG